MSSPIHSISVPATIEGVKFDKDFVPSKESKNRVKELGLEALLHIKNKDASKSLEILEANVWKMASNVKKRRFGYEKKDFIKTLNFLEIFCMYV
ncbi:hypothetical protein [Candidatus Protochlamydia amoebophila]|uniref:Uncharacterized protein n=1 Tax=Protochlamydia amoebophila (strain UWE25) TaxID=264201 RepID=A0A2P9H9H1_PARUW|nr:hypothetical protein [Candidatus Protochlamydia amoebophila]SPJ31651.1 unnamed protein product [Candidatus Protochlamydia amoebophila UWE25]